MGQYSIERSHTFSGNVEHGKGLFPQQNFLQNDAETVNVAFLRRRLMELQFFRRLPQHQREVDVVRLDWDRSGVEGGQAVIADFQHEPAVDPQAPRCQPTVD